MNPIVPDGWYDLAKRLPSGLDGALEPGGMINGIIPTDFHGIELEVVDEFDLIVEHASEEERCIGDDATVGWIVDKVLRAWLAQTGFYNHLVIDAGRVFWFNPDDDPERARLLVDVHAEADWSTTRARLEGAVRLIAYRRVCRWVSHALRLKAALSARYSISHMERSGSDGDRIQYFIWDRECYPPVKAVTVHASGRVDVRPAPDGGPDVAEFCPGDQTTGLSRQSGDAIKALLDRVAAGLAS